MTPPRIGLLLVAGGIGLLAAAIWVPPQLLDTHGITNPVERTKAINDFRGTLVTVVGGLALAAGTVVAALNLRHNRHVLEQARRQNDDTQRQNRETLDVTRRGQLTERFTRAVELLGNDKLDIRLGGVYALEQIAEESEVLHGPVVEILTAFLREHSHADQEAPAASSRPWVLRADFQSIATVLGRRRDVTHDRAKFSLDLRNARLEAINFHDAKLQRAFFEGAQLQHAFFAAAQLQGAYFGGAQLQGAYFGEAQLQRADFYGADLEGTKFAVPGADELDAKGLTPEQMSSAKNLEFAVLPGYLLVGLRTLGLGRSVPTAALKGGVEPPDQ